MLTSYYFTVDCSRVGYILFVYPPCSQSADPTVLLLTPFLCMSTATVVFFLLGLPCCVLCALLLSLKWGGCTFSCRVHSAHFLQTQAKLPFVFSMSPHSCVITWCAPKRHTLVFIVIIKCKHFLLLVSYSNEEEGDDKVEDHPWVLLNVEEERNEGESEE